MQLEKTIGIQLIRQSESGSSVYYFDLSNEMDGVVLGADGKTLTPIELKQQQS